MRTNSTNATYCFRETNTKSPLDSPTPKECQFFCICLVAHGPGWGIKATLSILPVQPSLTSRRKVLPPPRKPRDQRRRQIRLQLQSPLMMDDQLSSFHIPMTTMNTQNGCSNLPQGCRLKEA